MVIFTKKTLYKGYALFYNIQDDITKYLRGVIGIVLYLLIFVRGLMFVEMRRGLS